MIEGRMSKTELADHIEWITQFCNGLIKERAILHLGTVVPQLEIREEPLTTSDIYRLKKYIKQLHREYDRRA